MRRPRWGACPSHQTRRCTKTPGRRHLKARERWDCTPKTCRPDLDKQQVHQVAAWLHACIIVQLSAPVRPMPSAAAKWRAALSRLSSIVEVWTASVVACCRPCLPDLPDRHNSLASISIPQADGGPPSSPSQSDSRGRASVGGRGRGRIPNGVPLAGGRGSAGMVPGRGSPRHPSTFADGFYGGRGPPRPRQHGRPPVQSAADPAVLDAATFPALGGARPGSSPSSSASVCIAQHCFSKHCSVLTEMMCRMALIHQLAL